MLNFADRLHDAVQNKKTPCIVGLDPRLEIMPSFNGRAVGASTSGVEEAIVAFNVAVLDAVMDLVPAVKPQIAFYEQYGIAGLKAFATTVAEAKRRGLIVIVDAKRNDIASTADAYASAFLDLRNPHGFGVDAITVSPFLGRDSLEPFVRVCAAQGTGIFVLTKTSNPGSGDLQDRVLQSGETVYAMVAAMVNELGSQLSGTCGYSSVGAVVGATFPLHAQQLRQLMPRANFLVPGYGAQGGTGDSVRHNFNSDGFGALINASRSVTYPAGCETMTRTGYIKAVTELAGAMIADVARGVSTTFSG